MDSQEVFNKVRDHLLAQNQESYQDGSCRYRGPDGLKCAIGALIDDEHYSNNLECYTVTAASVTHALHASGVDADVKASLLDALQRVHDYDAPYDWRTRLADVAHVFGLTP